VAKVFRKGAPGAMGKDVRCLRETSGKNLRRSWRSILSDSWDESAMAKLAYPQERRAVVQP
jgi:hypothetical protein